MIITLVKQADNRYNMWAKQRAILKIQAQHMSSCYNKMATNRQLLEKAANKTAIMTIYGQEMFNGDNMRGANWQLLQ